MAGPAQQLAEHVLGKSGRDVPEEVYKTIEDYAKSRGGGKDLDALSDVMKVIPESFKGNFRNTFLRRLGTEGDTFSPHKFADEWKNKVNPQAKLVIMGDGAHIRALDALANASENMDITLKKFGNISGSGTHVNYIKALGTAAGLIVGGKILGPLNLLGGWYVGKRFANFLATPAGASSAARFAEQMQRFHTSPNRGQYRSGTTINAQHGQYLKSVGYT